LPNTILEVSDLVKARPAICLSMIVRDDAYLRDDAYIIQDTLDSVAPYISSWVIVDTGSTDGTQHLIRDHMARLGIPGKLHERPWRNFGHNRTEAMDLAQGHGDYIWVIDAEDTLVGLPEFTELSADAYTLRYRRADTTEWRTQVFRDGLRWHYDGVVLETPACKDPYVAVRLDGEYHIESRQLGARSLDLENSADDTDLLLGEVERNPEDLESVILLAHRYFDQGDFANARKWFARRLEIGSLRSTEEVYFAMYRLAVSMANLGEPWPDVQDAYLKAWEFRPTRAEPLHAIAVHYRCEQDYQLGYQYAERAAQIPLPERDAHLVQTNVYAWSAIDEQAICASWLGKHAEAFSLCRRLLARLDTPDTARQRIAVNRDFSVPAMVEAASSFPDALVGSLVAGPRDSKVTVSLVAGPDQEATEQALNSFLNCCADVSRVGRFVVVYEGVSALDRQRLRERAKLRERYGFVEFVDCGRSASVGAELAQLREEIGGRYWLHIGQGWQFFAPEKLITRLTAVLETERNVFQVGINFADAVKPDGGCAAEEVVRRAPDAGRYVLSDVVAIGPAMFDTKRLDQAGVIGTDANPLDELRQRAAAAGLQTASLDEVLCRGSSPQTVTTLAEVIPPTASSTATIHRFCITHTTPLLPENWYDDCIALGEYQPDSASHVSRLDRFWHEARPIAYAAAGTYVLPIAIERFADTADLIEISYHRKKILLSPEGIQSPMYPAPAYRELTVDECREKSQLLSGIVPPNDSGFLVSHLRYFPNGIIGLYNLEFYFRDILDYTSLAIEMDILDNDSATNFLTSNFVIPGGVEFGIFPKPWLVPVLSDLERLGRQFLCLYGKRIKGYINHNAEGGYKGGGSYQVRAVNFLSELLGSFLLLRHLSETYSNHIPADIFGYMACVVETGKPFIPGRAEVADALQLKTMASGNDQVP
jgi:tetratricopeptide (TPR) repeat protein